MGLVGPGSGPALAGLPGPALGLGPAGLPGLALGSAAAVATPPGLALALPGLAQPVSGRFLPRLASLPTPLALTLLVAAPLALAALARALARPVPTARPQPGRVLKELARAPSALMQLEPVTVLGTVTLPASVTCARRSPRACRCRPTATISLTIWCPGSALTASNAARMRKWSSYAKP